MLEIEKWKG